MFCYLRLFSLVSMATAVGGPSCLGVELGGWEEAGAGLGKEQLVSMVRAGEPNVGSLWTVVGSVVSMVGQGGDG